MASRDCLVHGGQLCFIAFRITRSAKTGGQQGLRGQLRVEQCRCVRAGSVDSRAAVEAPARLVAARATTITTHVRLLWVTLDKRTGDYGLKPGETICTRPMEVRG